MCVCLLIFLFLSTHPIRGCLRPEGVVDEHSTVQSKCQKDKSSHWCVSLPRKGLKTFSEESNSERCCFLTLPAELNDAAKLGRVWCHVPFISTRGLTAFS